MEAQAAITLLRRHASRASLPGAVLGVLRDGERMFACHGVADLASGQPVVDDTPFSLGSLTKSVTATVLLDLAEEGRVSLDDPVAARVPELATNHWAAGATVRDLMANRSRLALRAASEFDLTSRREDVGDDALAALAASVCVDLADRPAAEAWSYTNVGWCLLGRVVEAVTGQTFEDAVRDRLAERCGWRIRFAGVDPVPSRAVGHLAGGLVPEPVPPLVVRAYGPAGASAVASADDLLSFAALHLADPVLAALRVEHAAVRIDGWLDAWCLGWARFDWAGGPAWGWDSVVPGERAVLRLFPDQRTAVVLLANGDHGRALYRSLFAELLPALTGTDMPVALAESEPVHEHLAAHAGVYAWPDRQVTVRAAGGGLVLEEDGQEAQALPVGAGTFLVDRTDPDTPTVTFGSYDDTGRPGVLYRMLWGLPRAGDRGPGVQR